MAQVSAIPQGMHTVIPVITINGCAEAIEFYKKAFGAEDLGRSPDASGKLIMHASVRIGDSTVFMGDEIPGVSSASPVNLWFYFNDVDAAFERAVKAGCKAVMPPTEMFWGDRMGQVTDPFGQKWTVATHVKDMTREEMKKAEGEFVAQTRETTDAFEGLAAKRDRRAEAAAADPEGLGNQRTGQKPEIDVHRAEFRPAPRARHTLVETGDDTGLRLAQRGGDRG